jgi:hypothetical protein
MPVNNYFRFLQPQFTCQLRTNQCRYSRGCLRIYGRGLKTHCAKTIPATIEWQVMECEESIRLANIAAGK